MLFIQRFKVRRFCVRACLLLHVALRSNQTAATISTCTHL